jgi:hypothetical protein
MSWTDPLGFRRRACDAVPAGAQVAQGPAAAGDEDEVDEELMFHLRSLVDDNVARGMSSDEAWRNARERFGSLRRYSEACRGASFGNRLRWWGLPALGLLLVGVLAGWVLREVRSLREAQVTILEAQSQMKDDAPPSAPDSEPPRSDRPSGLHRDLAGRIVDRNNQPIAGADVLVILKTWPGGSYRQEEFATRSDRAGAFRLPALVPGEGQRAVLVAAVKAGYVLVSQYQLSRKGEPLESDSLTLQLDDGAPITLVVQDSLGRPVANARVAPASRRSPAGEIHVVYFQGSEPVHAVSDAQGQVDLSGFARGDQAEIRVQLPGQDWEKYAIEIPGEGDTVVLSAI